MYVHMYIPAQNRTFFFLDIYQLHINNLNIQKKNIFMYTYVHMHIYKMYVFDSYI